MTSKIANYRYLVLGLLTQQPMSGYDIKQLLSNLSWLISSPSFGSLYPALHALQKDGLVTVTVIPREDKPPRKVYSITTTGNQVLHEWIDQPATTDFSVRTFLMVLMTVGTCEPTALLVHLQQRRSQIAEHVVAIEQQAASAQDENEGQSLVTSYAQAMAAAELAWLDQTLEQLAPTGQPASE